MIGPTEGNCQMLCPTKHEDGTISYIANRTSLVPVDELTTI